MDDGDFPGGEFDKRSGWIDPQHFNELRLYFALTIRAIFVELLKGFTRLVSAAISAVINHGRVKLANGHRQSAQMNLVAIELLWVARTVSAFMVLRHYLQQLCISHTCFFQYFSTLQGVLTNPLFLLRERGLLLLFKST